MVMESKTVKFESNAFLEEMSELFSKHRKSLTSDKSGISLVDSPYDVMFLTPTVETASTVPAHGEHLFIVHKVKGLSNE